MNSISEKEFTSRWETATKKVFRIDYKVKHLVKRIALCPENNQSVTVHLDRVAIVTALLNLLDIDFVMSRPILEKKRVAEIRPKSLSDYREDREEKEYRRRSVK